MRPFGSECFVCDAVTPRETERPFVYAACQQAAAQGPEFAQRVSDGLLDLVIAWNGQVRLEERRAATGRLRPESYPELEEWVQLCGSLMEPDARDVPGKPFFRTVLELAARRFGTGTAEV